MKHEAREVDGRTRPSRNIVTSFSLR